MQYREVHSSFGHFHLREPTIQLQDACTAHHLSRSYLVPLAAGLPDSPTCETLNVAAEARRVTVSTVWTPMLTQ